MIIITFSFCTCPLLPKKNCILLNRPWYYNLHRPHYAAMMESADADDSIMGQTNRSDRLLAITNSFLLNDHPVILHFNPLEENKPGIYIVLIGYDESQGMVYYADPKKGGYIGMIEHDRFIADYWYTSSDDTHYRWDGSWLGFYPGDGNRVPGDFKFSFHHDGYMRSYIMHIPDGIDFSSPVPLVMDFHGIYQRAAGQKKWSGFYELSENASEKFVVVFPEGIPAPGFPSRHSWNTETASGADFGQWLSYAWQVKTDDVGYVRNIIPSGRSRC